MKVHVSRAQALGAVTAALALVSALPAASLAHGRPSPSGAVFVQSNQPGGNAILSFRRWADGSLTPAGRFPTGGRGASQDGAMSDPLASQGSLSYDPAHGLLYAVNAGSDTISVLEAHGAGLRLRQVLPSGGEFPSSVAVHGRLVYVLDAGGEGTIQGYRLGWHGLHPIRGSARSLGLGNAQPPFFLSSPAQIGFAPDGRELLVTTKTHGVVDAFAISRDGRPAPAPVITATGPVPFAFAFDARQRLVLADASGAANTFRVTPGGALTPVGVSVANGQTATCWLTSARGYWYATNTGSDTITGYAESAAGQLLLLDPSGVSATTDHGPTDLAAAPGGRTLYELNGLSGTLGIYRAHRDGSLTRTGTVTGLPRYDGAGGIAAQGVAVD